MTSAMSKRDRTIAADGYSLNAPYMSQLTRLVDIARLRSPYYAEHYRDLPATGWRLTDLPLVEPERYWQDNQGLKSWPVLTAPVNDAIVFKTGGTTGGGKLSVFTRDEWRIFVTTFSRSIASQLQAGDRVANLFFAGDLYASFLFIHGALSQMSTPVCEYPFTGAVDHDALTAQIVQHEINVLAGVPATLLHYAAALEAKGIRLPGVVNVLYGGESMFADQLQSLKRVLPQAKIASIGCASVDAGLIGAGAPDCLPGEHRVFEPETIVEIIDETSGEPIIETDRPGLLVATNLTRVLMPMIRYPVGDLAVWREAPGRPERKFMLLGRSSLGHRLRVGYITLFPDQLAALIGEQVGQSLWQLLIAHRDGCDYLTLRIAFAGDNARADALLAALRQSDATIGEMIDNGQLQIRVEWRQPGELTRHPRTGKLQRVIDQRAYQIPAGEAK